MGLPQRLTMRYRVCKRLLVVTRGFQVVTKGYRGLQGVTRAYGGLQGFTEA